MAKWQEINEEILKAGNTDQVRRQKLDALAKITQRPVLLYAVDMFNGGKIAAAGGDIAIDLSDKDGFFEGLTGISGPNLDVIIHSPGGSPEATESLVNMLRSRFNHIRVIVPSVAKSAATMFAMAADEIIMGTDAEMGPTDVQLKINGRLQPAHAILRQFEKAKKELAGNNKDLPAWLPILQQYGPALLVECEDGQTLTRRLVEDWVAQYMLKGQKDAVEKAKKISQFLASKDHLSHGRAIPISELKKMGVNIKLAAECTPSIAQPIQDINYAILQTFSMTPTYKLFENNKGPGLYKQVKQTATQLPMMMLPTKSPTGITKAPLQLIPAIPVERT